MKYFALDSSHIVEGYVTITSELNDISQACFDSEFQYLNGNEKIVPLKDCNGTIWPDFIYENGIPLISQKFKSFLDENKVDNLFYKKLILKTDREEKEYYLALPPKIDCLNLENTVVDDLFGTVEHFEINTSKVGRYKIFKAAGVTNADIIITENFAELIKAQNFIGVHIFRLK